MGYLTVLDIGSATASLDRKIYNLRPDISVVNINPGYVNPFFRHSMRDYNKYGLEIAAFNPFLPLPSNYFDVVIDSWSSVANGKSWDRKLTRITEMMRIAKRGGQLFVGPIDDKLKNKRLEDVNALSGVKSCRSHAGFSMNYNFQIQKI